MARMHKGKIVSWGFMDKRFQICIAEDGLLYFYAWKSEYVRMEKSGEYILPDKDGNVLGITPELCAGIPGAHELIKASAPLRWCGIQCSYD